MNSLDGHHAVVETGANYLRLANDGSAAVQESYQDNNKSVPEELH